MSDGLTLAAALLALREHLGLLRAVEIVVEAVEQAGDVAAMVRQLEEERTLLDLEIETLRRERGGTPHE